MISNLLELYARCGKSLLKNGLYEAVLPISEMENAMELFQRNRFVILGGDLYKEVSDNNFESVYADWFYDGSSIEDSIDVARKYLISFQEQSIFIAFVLKNLSQKAPC